MPRRHDWPERLAEVVRAARGRPFQWGRHDCALFAFDCVAAMTGVDHTARYRGRYRTAKGAYRALARIGGVRTLDDLATALTKRPALAEGPRAARRGDLVIHDTDDGPALGVCLGARLVAVGPGGLAYRPMSAVTRAWRV